MRALLESLSVVCSCLRLMEEHKNSGGREEMFLKLDALEKQLGVISSQMSNICDILYAESDDEETDEEMEEEV